MSYPYRGPGPYGRPPQQGWGNPWAAPGGGRPAPGWGGPPRQPYRPQYRPIQGNVYAPRAGGGSRGCGLALAITAIIGVLVLAVPAILLGVLWESVDTTTYSSYTYSTYSTSSSEQTTDYPTTDYPTTAYTTTAPTTTYTPEPTPDPTRSQGAGNYVNDGYAPPPVGQGYDHPYPQTLEEADWWRTSNALYDQQIGSPVRCELPPANEVATSDADYLSMMEQWVTCMMGAWNPPLVNAGYTLTMPSLYVMHGEVVTPCGHAADFAGYYCSSELGMIYMNLNSSAVGEWPNSDGLQTFNFESVLAHEFGHHVQSRMGVMMASHWLQDQLTGDAALQENRRRELQVQCFAGLFLNAASQSAGLTQADRDALWEWYATGGDYPTHGTAYHRAAWQSQGLNTTEIYQCNTFLASDADVA